MTIEKVECYIATCDGCGEDRWDADVIPHFQTRRDLHNSLDGITESPGGKLYCEECAGCRLCEKCGAIGDVKLACGDDGFVCVTCGGTEVAS